MAVRKRGGQCLAQFFAQRLRVGRRALVALVQRGDDVGVVGVVFCNAFASEQHFKVAHRGRRRVGDAAEHSLHHVVAQPHQFGHVLLGQLRAREHFGHQV